MSEPWPSVPARSLMEKIVPGRKAAIPTVVPSAYPAVLTDAGVLQASRAEFTLQRSDLVGAEATDPARL